MNKLIYAAGLKNVDAFNINNEAKKETAIAPIIKNKIGFNPKQSLLRI
jgi:hypothetical protein